MRSLLNAVKTGFSEIRAHKMRSVLSFLAIAVGSVVFIDSFSAICATYERQKMQKEVSGMARFKISQNYGKTWSSPDEYVPPPVFTYEDALDLKRMFPEFYMISPVVRTRSGVLEYNGRRMTMSLAGVTPEWTKRDFTYSLKGRFIDRHDLENKLRVCVLIKKAVPPFTGNAGKSLLKKYDYTGTFDMLIGHNELLGKTVQINGMTFTVVGILEGLPYSKRPSTILAAGQDYNVLAPIPTLMQYDFISPSQSLDLSVDTGNEQSFEDSLRRVQNFLKVHFGDEDFFIIENQLETIREFIANSVKASLMTISLGMLAFIAGGIGIMNVTLATVFARTKEIGIRRAIGASRGDIMMQFIVEAVMLGFIGGVLGSGIGYLWGVPVKVMIGLSVSPIKPWMPFISIFIAAFTAFLFAIYPAWVAAGLKPADALRAE